MAKIIKFPVNYHYTEAQKKTIAAAAAYQDQIQQKTTQSGQAIAAKNPQKSKSQYDKWVENLAMRADATAGWNKIRYWKRIRWTLCAFFRSARNLEDPPLQNPSGRNLYFRYWYRQHTQPGHQPISPCARRVTDPTASPFDYTP